MGMRLGVANLHSNIQYKNVRLLSGGTAGLHYQTCAELVGIRAPTCDVLIWCI